MTPPLDSDKAGARRQRLSASALVAAAALGPLLIGSVVYGHRAVTRASQSVLRAEAEAWTRQLGSRLRGQTWVVVEFEPRTWGELNSTSRATLAVGSVTALAVCFLALWVWRSSQRVLAIEQETARARHLAALGEMSAVLAHEIRNPLTSLKGHSQLLVESLEALGLEKPRGKAERVVKEAVRLEQITNDLLDFVKQGELDRAP